MQALRNFQPRVYQETIFASCLSQNCLVVLPTGLGKTAISLMLGVALLSKDETKKKKIVIMAPTRPLVHQHYETFLEKVNPDFLHEDEFLVITGAIKAEKRKELWQDARVIFTTPQGLENDILSKRITLEDVALMVFDEAHRATGDYSYVWIASQYKKQNARGRILALTASPGTDQEVVDLVCKNLFIEKIEYRDRESPDVKSYVKDVKFLWREVDLPVEFHEVLKLLNGLYSFNLKKLKPVLGQLNKNKRSLSKKDLLSVQAHLQGMISRGEGGPELYTAISDVAQIFKVQHAIELLETQGVGPAVTYCDDLWKQGTSKKTKAAMKLIAEPDFKTALTKLWRLRDDGFEHPKIPELLRMVLKMLKDKEDAKIIVFNNYRDSISNLYDKFSSYDVKNTSGKNLVRPAIFVGQAKKKGMGISQKEQLKIIEEFREGVHNVVIMSSVGEEGLDIPAVDAVIFYEPVPSAIRQIQRAGRTGRQETGKVYVLVAKNTRDVAYRWSTEHKQRRMYEVLDKADSFLIKDEDVVQKKHATPQKTLLEVTSSNSSSVSSSNLEDKIVPKIIVDSREKSNRIVKHLVDDGVDIILKQLEIGDYVLDEHTGVEFKTKKDFVDSIVDGRLFTQASALSRNFSKPLFVVQGEEDLYSLRNISGSAILGALSSLAVSFRIPVLFTKDDRETAAIFLSVLKKQKKDLASFSMHTQKPKNDERMQEYLVSALPGIGPNVAKSLLLYFGSVQAVYMASVEELSLVAQVGKGKAEQIRQILEKRYQSK